MLYTGFLLHMILLYIIQGVRRRFDKLYNFCTVQHFWLKNCCLIDVFDKVKIFSILSGWNKLYLVFSFFYENVISYTIIFVLTELFEKKIINFIKTAKNKHSNFLKLFFLKMIKNLIKKLIEFLSYSKLKII